MARIIELEQGWDYLSRNGVQKLINLLEGNPEEKQFSAEEYMILYTYPFNCMHYKKFWAFPLVPLSLAS